MNHVVQRKSWDEETVIVHEAQHHHQQLPPSPEPSRMESFFSGCDEERFYVLVDAYGIYVVCAILLYLVSRSRGGLGFVKVGVAGAVLSGMLWFFLHMGEVKRDQGELRLKYDASCVTSTHYDAMYCHNLLVKVRSMTTIGVVSAWIQRTWEAFPVIFTEYFMQGILIVLVVGGLWIVKEILAPMKQHVSRNSRVQK